MEARPDSQRRMGGSTAEISQLPVLGAIPPSRVPGDSDVCEGVINCGTVSSWCHTKGSPWYFDARAPHYVVTEGKGAAPYGSSTETAQEVP